MYPISRAVRREPRQPVKEKGVTVYSTETPQSVAVTETNVQQEAMASVALDGETQSFEEPRDKEEPMKKEPLGLPAGEQGTTVEVVIGFVKPGDTFTANSLWESFGSEERGRWVTAYGGESKAIKKVRHAISNLRSAGRVHVHNIERGKWVKEPAIVPAYFRADHVPERDPWEPEGDLGDYKHIGTDLDGEPLYYDGITKRVGTLTFKPVVNLL